ncbi:MAG TPA: DUF4143 domain-containing protein, partial [Bacteroidales bacterium]|nr:DUF4143 domain-containing protein [Bacteroidales bacterium]
LASFLLNITHPDQLVNHYLKGNLFENLIIIELLKKRFNNGLTNNLWFFRDSHGNEIDLIPEALNLRAVEIKSSRTFSTGFTDGFKWFQKISEVQNRDCFVIYGGDESYSFNDFHVLSYKNLDSLM